MQYVACQDLRTNATVNKFGVPQGNNFGPLLCLIFINYLPNALSSLPKLCRWYFFNNSSCFTLNIREKNNQELVNVSNRAISNDVSTKKMKK